jgi:CHAT domain-containing protein
VLTLLQLGRTAEAFAVADAARSRELLQQLTSARATAEPAAAAAAGTAEFAAAELLLRRIDALLDQLREMDLTPAGQRSGVESTTGDIMQRVARLRDEYESLQIRSAGADPRSSRMLGVTRTEEAGVLAVIGTNEVLLHYTMMEDRLVVFAARAGGLTTVQVTVSGADVASRVRLLRELWGTPNAALQRGLPAARGLHQILIAPVARAGLLAGATRLVIVPHGVLEQLPFAALQDPDTERFLVEDFDIAYAPSANTLVALRESAQAAPVGVRRVLAFAPLTAALPATRLEAAAASRGAAGGTLHVDGRATEQAVRRALADSAVVHIASHGVLNSRNPMFSRMELARGPRSGSSDDGRLEVHEVLQLRVNSPLVVLSGCETGVGDHWSADPLRPSGVTTLAQAFLQAGARSVMATLWRVDDVGSAELVSRFYQHAAGSDPASALSRAQRTMIRDTTHSAPYYWAGYILLGDGLANRPGDRPPEHSTRVGLSHGDTP